MNSLEWRATGALSAVQTLRLLGMFMILPVFALYARDLPGGATDNQIGLAIGMYGLVQAALQIPFGTLSDRIGRKPVIVLGLLLFAVGSFVAGATHNIVWIIIGRSLQGGGAISGAVSALVADATRLEVRTKAMTIYGIGMGLAFILALIVGPILDGWIGVNGIFTLTGCAALLAIPLVIFGVPTVPRAPAPAITGFNAVLNEGPLLKLDLGILLLHMMMIGLFTAAPHAIETTLGLARDLHWHVYLPVLLVSVFLVFPVMRVIEKRGMGRPAFISAVLLLGVALGIASEIWRHPTALYVVLTLFFIAFNYLEGTLPSLISKRAPPERKGAALGVYATAQSLGQLGAYLGQWAFGRFGTGGAFAATAILSLIWLPFAFSTVPAAAENDSSSPSEEIAGAVRE